MTQLQISAPSARRMWVNANNDTRLILEESFGREFFYQSITERVKTLDDVFIELGVDKEQFYKDCGALPSDEIGYREVKLIVQVLNEGWKPNWDDEDERKWRPWFYMAGPGGFRFDVSYYGDGGSIVGSRLCFKSEELSNYAAKTFTDIYKKFFTA